MPLDPLPKQPPGSWKSPQASSFHFSLPAAWAAIGFLWLITPLSWLYILWTLLTLIPTLRPGRPAPSHRILLVLHYVTLAYCCLEVPFSIYYRFLAIRANARRYTPQYTRRFLRSVFKRSLENGLDPEDAEEEALEEMGLDKELARDKAANRATHSYAMRQRKGQLYGDGSITPELASNVTLQPEWTPSTPNGRGEDEGYGESNRSSVSVGASVRTTEPKKNYVPSFIQPALEPEDPRAHDFRDFIRLWFNGCDYDEIQRLNMADWLAWSLYGQPLHELEEERAAWEAAGKPDLHVDGELDVDDDGLEIERDKLGLVDHCVDLVEARAGRTFKIGRNPKVKVIRLTLDPVRVASRPLILYGFVFALQKTVIAHSQYHGFRDIRDGDTRYLVRIPPGWKPSRNCSESNRPLLFIHGLGMGMAQYATLLGYLSIAKTLTERPIVVLIQPHISMSFFSKGYLHPPNQSTCTAGLNRMAKRWGFGVSGLTVLSHSNGSIVHGWLVKDYPDLVVRSCFVDPVCFCLWEPWVCYNFLYSTPRTPIEYLMRYFVSRELGVALMLQRTFDWSSNLLFPTDIPNLQSPYHSAFFLAGRDSILHAERIRRYLRRHGVQEVNKGENVGAGRGGLKVHAGKKHGESMIGSGLAFNQIMAWVTSEVGEDDGVPEGESSAADSVA